MQKEVDAAKKDGRSSVLMLTQQPHGPTLYLPVPLPRSIHAMAPTAGADLPPSQPGPSMPARAVSEPTNIMELGLAIDTISRDLVTKFDLPGNQKGVVVTEVSPDGSAAKHGIKAGDVILAISAGGSRRSVGSAKGSGRSEERRPKQRANANPTTARPDTLLTGAATKIYRRHGPHGGCRFATITTRSEHADAGRV